MGIQNQMSSLKQLTANQLSKMLTETQAELKRRENIDKARKDIKAILKNIRSLLMILTLASVLKNQLEKSSCKKSTEKKPQQKRLEPKNALLKPHAKTTSAPKLPRNIITLQPVINGLAVGVHHHG